MARPITPLADRFWPRVNMSAGPDACWPWTGYCDANGYGRVAGDRPGHNQRAPVLPTHRAAFLLTHGYLTPGLEVMHTCDVRPCCNPAHLAEGTHHDNVTDAHTKRRHGRLMPHYAAIRAAHTAGETQTSLARRYGCSQGAIWNIVRRRYLV